MCSMLIFLSACSGGGANASDPVSSGSPEATATVTTEPDDSRSSVELEDYITEESLSWDEILEGVGSTSAKDALVNNYEATKQFLETWLTQEKNNYEESLVSVEFHNPKIYFSNDAGANCIFEMDLKHREPDSDYSYESANVRIYEDYPERFVFEFARNNYNTKTNNESLPTYEQARQFMKDANEACDINHCMYDPNKIEYPDFYTMIRTDLGIDELKNKEVTEKVANHIAEYWKNNGYTEVNIAYDEGENWTGASGYEYVVTAVIPDITRIKGMITFELGKNFHSNSEIKEHYGYFDRYSNEYIQLGSFDDESLRPASELENLIKSGYESYLESKEYRGELVEFD